MLFSSITFIYFFLPITLIVYGVASFFDRTGYRLRNLVLFLVSCLFYAWGEPVYVFLMIAQILVAYGLTKLYEKKRDSQIAKVTFSLAVFLPFASLFYFKYSGADVTLPIGISFYTFQITSYVIDVKRGRVHAPRSILTLATYVTLFPQLIAGPIVRYSDIDEELISRQRNGADLSGGMIRFLCGLGKKVLVANVLGEFVMEGAKIGSDNRTIALSWAWALAVSLQIYFDFSGYSDMAIGLGKMFGFHFPENFRYPFISKSMSEFWRRWHMTLGGWFRDYVYIPLGGNRVPFARWIFNIFVVWALTGLWHGAGWNFVIWGLYFGVLLVVERLLKKVFVDRKSNIFASERDCIGSQQSTGDRAYSDNGPAKGKMSDVILWILKHIYVVIGVMISFIIFHDASMTEAFRDISSLWRVPEMTDEACGYILRNRLGILVIAVIGSTPLPHMILDKITCAMKKEWIVLICEAIGALALLVLCTAYLIDGSFNPFLYFRF